jgi:tRNA threonylcarbamoyladenosine biosynthesis protein TsaB
VVYLGIDTSTTFLSLALWSDHVSLAKQENLGRDHAKRLILRLDQLLQEAKATRADLAGIGVGIGPGSYTGLRVGIASAKGLSRALGIPLSGVDSLAAAAYGCIKEGEKAWLSLDARRGNVYAGLYEKQQNSVLTLKKPKKLELTHLQQTYPDTPLFQDQVPNSLYIAQQAQGSKLLPRALYL